MIVYAREVSSMISKTYSIHSQHISYTLQLQLTISILVSLYFRLMMSIISSDQTLTDLVTYKDTFMQIIEFYRMRGTAPLHFYHTHALAAFI